MFDAKTITQAPIKSTAAAKAPAKKKSPISKKQAALIAAALKKHAAKKPHFTVSVHTPSTYVDSEDLKDGGIDEATEKD